MCAVSIDMRAFDFYKTELETLSEKATYKDIQAWTKKEYDIYVCNLNIAQMKEKCGLSKGKYTGQTASGKYPTPKLTPEKEEAIKAAFQHFGML